MSKLNQEDILKLARLSRLRLSDEEISRYQAELSEILNYVEILNEVDASGLEPTYQVTGLTNQTRADELDDEGPYKATPAELLKNAPAVEQGQFKVKRVLL